MAKRNLSLNTRSESTRESFPAALPIHFTLDEIKAHFDENMASVRKQFDIADALIENGKIPEAETIWRSQVVLAEASLDFYLHEINKYCLYQIFIGNWARTYGYNDISIPITTVEKALASSKSSEDWFFEFINHKYSCSVFMSAKKIKELLNLTGLKFETVMQTLFPDVNRNEAEKMGCKLLSQQFDRRNSIVHQLDRSHASAIQATISRRYAEQYAANTIRIVDAIHRTAIKKEGR